MYGITSNRKLVGLFRQFIQLMEHFHHPQHTAYFVSWWNCSIHNSERVIISVQYVGKIIYILFRLYQYSSRHFTLYKLRPVWSVSLPYQQREVSHAEYMLAYLGTEWWWVQWNIDTRSNVSFVVLVMSYERRIKAVLVSHAVSERCQIYDLEFKCCHIQCPLFQNFILC
jgi:hypothetical protein